MKTRFFSNTLFTNLLLFICYTSAAQMPANVYHYEEKNSGATHELKIGADYFIYSIYKKSPAEFLNTMGGFYMAENDTLKVKLEFNSSYETDSIATLNLPYSLNEGNLILTSNGTKEFKAGDSKKQDLDGAWLFGTRGPDTGQERRGESNPRKTLKFLMNGHFQWIAYHTETFRFSGTGGGSFTSKDGFYIENIEFFSRDNARVGAKLQFEYELMGNDWHHKGKNSKGEPMYEIWARR